MAYSVDLNKENIGIGLAMAAPTLCCLYFRKDGLIGNPLAISALLSVGSRYATHPKSRRVIEWGHYFLISCSLLRIMRGATFFLGNVLDAAILGGLAFAGNPNAFNAIWAGPLVVFLKTPTKK